MARRNAREVPPSPPSAYQETADLFLFKADPRMRLVCLFCFIFMLTRAAARQRSASWVESLARTFLTVFGGSTLVPLILNTTPVYLANDMIFAMTLLAWVLTHRTPIGRLVEDNQVLRLPLNLLGHIFRAHGVCGNVTAAAGAIAATEWYPTPIFGPIVLGTLGSTGGMFLPFDKGLGALGSGMSLGFEIPLAAATFYHFMINDTKGMVGQQLREILGALSRDAVTLCIVAWFTSVFIVQELLDPEFDPFRITGFHSVFNAFVPARGYDLDSAPRLQSSASIEAKKKAE